MIEALKSSRFLFMLPEKGQKTSTRRYRQLADFASKLGLEVYMIDIRWSKHNSLLECALEATRKVHEIVDELHPTEIYFFGFGIGAMISAQVGFLFRANGLLLCSMPPLFHEELSQFPKLTQYFWRRKIYAGRNKPAYPNKKIKTQTVFIHADKERKQLDKIKTVRSAAFPKSTEVFVPKSAAALRNKKYFETVLSETEKMLRE